MQVSDILKAKGTVHEEQTFENRILEACVKDGPSVDAAVPAPVSPL